MSVFAISYGDPIRLWFLVGVVALAAIYVVLQWRRQQYAVRRHTRLVCAKYSTVSPSYIRRGQARYAFAGLSRWS